jgi:transposase
MSQPSPSKPISREQIRAIYIQGEDAVIALVEGLLECTERLETRLEALENQRQKDSRNSSKPRSTLGWSEQVDEVVRHRVLQCEACGHWLDDVAVESWVARQVHELPPVRLVVSEHQAEEKRCSCCRVLNRAAFPAGVNSVVQYGRGIKGLMVYLMVGQLLPSLRMCDLLRAVVGLEVSEGTRYNACSQCDEQLEPVEQQLQGGDATSSGGAF